MTPTAAAKEAASNWYSFGPCDPDGLAQALDAFAAAVEATHATNPLHLEDYRAIVADMRRILAREVGNG